MNPLTILRADQLMYFAWPVAEVVLSRRRAARGAGTEVLDRGSLWVLWALIAGSITLAMFARPLDPYRLGLAPMTRAIVVTGLLVIGLGLRAWSIVALGKFFTVQVAVLADHHVVRAGPYRWLRHPSYAGALIAFVGLGVLTNSPLSLCIILLGIGAGFVYRIRVEERALRDRLGADYAEYARVTRRLIPFIY